LLPSLNEAFSILFTFGLTTFAWIFFRASSVTKAFEFIAAIFQSSLLSMPTNTSKSLFMFLAFFVCIEWLGRENNYAIQNIKFMKNKWMKWLFYYSIAMSIFMFAGKEQQFIYFQF
jgi:hypothetical protein